MIEFYQKYFPQNYKSKVKQLIIDIERLLYLEEIEVCKTYDFILPTEFSENLTKENWNRINQLYFTLYDNKSSLSKTLKKFFKKNNKDQTSKIKFIDTFAGCGGLSFGLEKAGFEPVLVNEIESKYLETYYFNRNLPLQHYFCGDIKELITEKNKASQNFDGVDLVVGGPPCQGFSMANRQRLLDDPRNKLYKYFLEFLRVVQPKFFIMENVKGMMNKSREIKSNFQEVLGEDYSIEIALLNAKDFGIPQNRERVFVIGSRDKKVFASQIIFDILNQKGKEKFFVLKDALYGLPKLEPKRIKNSKGLENDKIGYKFRKTKIKSNEYANFINKKVSNEYIYNHTNRYNNDRDIEIFGKLPQGANSLHPSIADIMPYSNRNHIFKDKYFKLDENKISKTITSHMSFDCNMYIHPTQSRGLSPREAARIQTFPDDFVFMGANNSWYSQIGNAVPVKLAEIIGKQIIKHLK